MTKLLIGAGVENSRNPLWGNVYRSLVDRGEDVFLFDLDAAERATLRGTPLAQLVWVLDEIEPDQVLLVPSSSEIDEVVIAESRKRAVPVLGLNIGELASSMFEGSVTVEPKVNSEILCPTEAEEIYDVVVVGPCEPNRQFVAEQLTGAGLKVLLVGTGWPDDSTIRQHNHGLVPYGRLAGAYCSARVAVVVDDLKPPRSPACNGVIHQALEAASCGRAVITTTDEVFRYLLDGPEALHCDKSELVGVVQSVLANDEWRRSLGAAARRRVEADHSWSKEWIRLLSAMPKVRVRKEGPRVSVITGLYKVEGFVGEAIESVLAQSYEDFELLIVDDCSPDNSRTIAEKYTSDPRVKLFEHHANVGQTGRFDLIWRSLQREARGEFLTSLGADDRMPTHRISRQLAVFDEELDVDVVHGATAGINAQGASIGPYGRTFSYHSADLLAHLFATNFVMVPTVMMRLGAQRHVFGEWATGFSADYDLWLKMLNSSRFRYLPEFLVEYRIHEQSASTSSEGYKESVASAERLVLEERSQRSLVDLYPCLEWVPRTTDLDWAAAHVDLGNRYSMYSGGTALSVLEYDAALRLAPGYSKAIYRNLAYVEIMRGDVAEATRYAREAGTTFEEMVAGPLSLVDASTLSTVPFSVPADHADDVYWWDGTPLSLRRIVLVPDWQRPDLMERALQFYFSYFRGVRDVDLAILTLGLSDDDALARVMSCIPHDVDLDSAPELTLERCDMVEILPVARYQGVVDCRESGGLSVDMQLAGLARLASEMVHA